MPRKPDWTTINVGDRVRIYGRYVHLWRERTVEAFVSGDGGWCPGRDRGFLYNGEETPFVQFEEEFAPHAIVHIVEMEKL